ncbi:MAG: DUF1858 domain-containing protein [Chloroflexi bacterium]|nr:DUF1858 domain-containing protein [Chloroflexota bacterium]
MAEQQTITANMSIGEVISAYPQTAQVFMSQGLTCIGCAMARFENIEQGAMAHGIDINKLMQALNEAIAQA